MHAPRAERRPLERTHHGDTITDWYEWLRDGESADVQAYLEAENAFTDELTADLAPAREQLFTDIVARTRLTDLSVASWVTHHGESADSYWYYSRTIEDKEYPIRCRATATDRDRPPNIDLGAPADELVYFDDNVEAAGHDFFSVGDCDPSPAGTRLAYSVDTTGDERYTLAFRTMDGQQGWPEQISGTSGGIAWAGEDTVLYTVADDAWRPYHVRRHTLGTDPATDQVVYTEDDDRFWLHVGNSRDNAWVIIAAGSKISSEIRLLPAADPDAEPRVVAPRRPGVEYDVEPAGDRLLIVHNDEAIDFALAQAPLDATSHLQWEPVIEHRQGVRLLGVDAHRDHVLLSLRQDGLTAIRVLPRTADGAIDTGVDGAGLPGRDVTVDEPVRTLHAVPEADYDSNRIRFQHTSLITPPRIVEEHFTGSDRRVLRQTPVLDHPTHGPYDPDRYVQERLWATAADGARIPISMVRRRDVTGPAPTILYGYGSYEIPMDPSFSIWRLSLLDQGVTWAIAHVRGGGEMGRSWYEDGKFAVKQNTFTDFVACGQHLVTEGYTTPEQLGAAGGSAGGLLMGAVANLAPELFTAILASVPFVDPLTSILDPDLPLTVIEWDEWGNPLEDPQIYAAMKAYSPYENVRATRYPAIMAATSFHDTRVLFVEPAKWIAQLRHTATNPDADFLLKVEMSAGHGGVSGRFQFWRQMAFEMSWLADRVINPR